MRKDRITIRLTNSQYQVLSELVEALDTSYSLLVRTIISDFLNRNEDVLERITLKHMQENANDKQTSEEAES